MVTHLAPGDSASLPYLPTAKRLVCQGSCTFTSVSGTPYLCQGGEGAWCCPQKLSMVICKCYWRFGALTFYLLGWLFRSIRSIKYVGSLLTFLPSKRFYLI